MRVALLISAKMFRDRVPSARQSDKQAFTTAASGPSWNVSESEGMFTNSIKDVDMTALTARSAAFTAPVPLGTPADAEMSVLPAADRIQPPRPANERRPGFAKRMLALLDPMRGKRLRETEKALFWERLEGLAGEIRMMGFRYAEESRVRDAALAALHQELAKRDRVIARLQGDLQFQRRRLNRLDRGKAAALPSSASPAVPGRSSDDTYLAFEERFRGLIDDIKDRLRPYLERVKTTLHLPPGRPLLDVGCGRGEWLELLAESGIEAYGVDLNEHAVALCEQRGLQTRRADVLEHLGALPEGALGAITAFHVIEHLPLEALRQFLNEAHRTLMAGGVLMLESPNPENIRVGATTFHNDPTHLRPIPPQLAAFQVEQAGFVDIDVLRLNPYPASSLVKEQSETACLLNELMFGPQDYAVIARKT